MVIFNLKAAFKNKYINGTDVEKIRLEKLADDVNSALRNVSQDPIKFNNPYKSGSKVFERVVTREEKYVRLITKDGDNFVNNPTGKWLARESDIQGLTASQIKNKYTLPFEPTHIIDVKISTGTKIREGVAGAVDGWGSGGNTQIELLENIDGFDLSSIRKIS